LRLLKLQGFSRLEKKKELTLQLTFFSQLCDSSL